MSLLKRLEEARKVGHQKDKKLTPRRAATKEPDNPLTKLKTKVYDKIVEEIDAELLKEPDEELKQRLLSEQVEDFIIEISSEEHISYTRAEHDRLLDELIHEILGLGPIEPLLKDPSVTEVMVNSYKRVYVERKGRLELTNVTFKDDQHVLHIIEKIVSPIGRRIDESSPYVDARLRDGSRVNAIIPPLAIDGPSLTIRKFFKEKLQVDDLIRFGSMTREMADFVSACVRARLNIIVSGGTGSGKTTTLNVLSSFIPTDERIVTVEDAAELQLHQDHVVRLETRPPNIEGKGAVTIRDLVRNCLRMRPDRIIVGEVRSGEALDMLQAMNTGHDGSLTTVHANSPRDTLSRISTMVLMAGMELPMVAIREQIASAIDLIIQQSRLQDGSRKITHISEVQGMEGDVITLQDIFIFEQKGIGEGGKVIGEMHPTGIRPKFYHKFTERGIELPAETFLYHR
ncbi:MAG: CpaF family protein [bacterium]|nr:CpaF family protein [bacterium]